jgi:hypothetical protein
LFGDDEQLLVHRAELFVQPFDGLQDAVQMNWQPAAF